MSEMFPAPEVPESDLLESTGRYLLSREPNGYAIWDLDDDSDEAAFTFPPTDDGEQEARETYASLIAEARRRRVLPLVLLWTAALSGAVWIFGGLALAIAYGQLKPSGDLPSSWIQWGQSAAFVGQPVFLVSAGLYFLVWLERRR
jgi:hypothetical protein